MDVTKRLLRLLKLEESNVDLTCLTKYICHNRQLNDDDGCFIVNQLLDNTSNNNSNSNIVLELDLSSNYISSNCISSIANMLKINTTLIKLNIRENTINQHGAVAIANSLQINTTLQELDIGRRQQQQYGDGMTVAKAFADMLIVNRTLKLLDLSDFNISPRGIQAIAFSLLTNNCLVCLRLCGSRFTQELDDTIGIHSNNNIPNVMVDMLQKNRTLEELSLTDVTISTTHLSNIITSLQHTSSLTCLDLSYNNLKDDIAIVVCDMLKTNTTLLILNLGSNKITSIGASHIAASLQENLSLIHLNLICNNLCIHGLTAMLIMLRDWNDTLQFLGICVPYTCDEIATRPTLNEIRDIVMENRTRTRIAPYKAERCRRRRRSIYNGLLFNWVPSRRIYIYTEEN
jgi:Leucine Rich repeat